MTFSSDEDTGVLVASATPPTGLRPGDTQLMIVASIDGAPADLFPPGWASIASLHSDNESVLTVLRRIAGSEPTTHSILMNNANFPACAVLIAYRNLRSSSGLVASDIVDVEASANFACPSLTLTTATDLYLGIAWVSDAAPAVTPPGGTTERFDASQTSDGTARRLEVFEFLKVSIGATGTKTATIAAPQSGIAASILLKASV